MSGLHFKIVGARAEPYTAAPMLSFRLRIIDNADGPVEAMALRIQLQIEPRRRHYDHVEEQRLEELFGTPERWGDTLRTLLWAHASLMVPTFSADCEIDVPVACTYDFDVAATKYLDGLQGGEIPVLMLFSGTVFRRGGSGFLVEQIPWEMESSYRLPVSIWRDCMNYHFPNAAWLRLHKDTFDELYRFKTRRAVTSWDDAVAELLEVAGEKL